MENWQQKQLWAVWTPRRNWCFCLLSFSNIIWLLILLWKGINDFPLPSNICFSWHIQCRWYSWHPQPLEASQHSQEIHLGLPATPGNPWEKFGELSKRPFELSFFEGHSVIQDRKVNMKQWSIVTIFWRLNRKILKTTTCSLLCGNLSRPFHFQIKWWYQHPQKTTGLCQSVGQRGMI